jgi:hypothetical protein
MGVSTSPTATDPTIALLESKYGAGSGSGTASSSTGSVLSSGNAGSSASVNAYA